MNFYSCEHRGRTPPPSGIPWHHPRRSSMVLHAAHADSNDLPYEVQGGLTARLTGPGGHRLIQIHLHQNQLIPDAVLAKPLVLMDQRRLHHILLVLTLAVDGGVDFIPRGPLPLDGARRVSAGRGPSPPAQQRSPRAREGEPGLGRPQEIAPAGRLYRTNSQAGQIQKQRCGRRESGPAFSHERRQPPKAHAGCLDRRPGHPRIGSLASESSLSDPRRSLKWRRRGSSQTMLGQMRWARPRELRSGGCLRDPSDGKNPLPNSPTG